MTNRDVWEKSWQKEDPEALFRYLIGSRDLEYAEIGFFKQAGIRSVCDVGCGFGAYTLALASRGFFVEGFDVSETAVRLTRENLKKLGYDVPMKAADILCTGYRDGQFDGVFAHSVLDHMTSEDARAAMEELFRIVRPGGLVLLSFDTPEEADRSAVHEVLPDGSLLCRDGMIVHPYDKDGILKLVGGRKIVFEAVNRKGEQIVILEKQPRDPPPGRP